MSLPNNIEDMDRPIEKYYAGKSVFVTGGTGFLGKVFVEKLLYSCPNIEKIYLLMREKDEVDTSERIKQLLDLPIFQRVKKERPENLKKVVPISGDVILPKLGIREEDDRILTETVSHVFHFAANIRFDEPLEVAMNCNLEGTRKVLNLCKRIKNIEAFVYVSTAYTNTDQRVLEEIVYPSPASIEEVYKIIEKKGGINKEQAKKLLCGRPNTYTFTKALAESLVQQERNNIPSIIIRPSIVTASLSEPLVGWIDNWFGATGMIATAAKGLNRIVLGKGSITLDLIPVDYVSNLIIAAAAKCNRSKELTVYNSCSSSVNPLTMEELSVFVFEDFKHNFSEFMRPKMMFTQSVWLLRIVTFIMQIIPAFVADCILRLSGKPPRINLCVVMVFYTHILNVYKYPFATICLTIILDIPATTSDLQHHRHGTSMPTTVTLDAARWS